MTATTFRHRGSNEALYKDKRVVSLCHQLIFLHALLKETKDEDLLNGHDSRITWMEVMLMWRQKNGILTQYITHNFPDI